MNETQIIIGLVTIVVFGIGAQWIGREKGIPSLLILLPAGLLAGSVLGLVQPQAMFGELLFPGVTLLVSLLLFQSAIKLRVADLPKDSRTPVLRLVTIGLTITFLGASLGVMYIFNVSSDIALLVGAIVVVSGPTVVGPLLSQVRPRKNVNAVLNWESVFLDPIGATLGIVILNLVLAAGRGGLHPLLQMLMRLGLGVAVGGVAAFLLILLMSRYLVPDSLDAAVTLMFAIAAFGIANVLLSEAGLFATTTLGFILANQRIVSFTRLKGVSETVEVLIIGSLFITLGALVSVEQLISYAVPILLLVAFLVLIVRPLAAGISLIRTKMTSRERAMVGLVDPRGIIAASTAAQFSVSLTAAGIASSFILPAAFGVILGTGIIYGLSAKPVAKRLGVTEPPRKGVGFIGDDPWLFDLAGQLKDLDVPVLVLTTAAPEDLKRQRTDVPVSSILYDWERVSQDIQDASISQVVFCAPESVVGLLIEDQAIESLGRRQVFHLPLTKQTVPRVFISKSRSRQPFDPGVTLAEIEGRLAAGATIRAISGPMGKGTIPLAAVAPDGTVNLTPGIRRSGGEDKIVALVGAQ